MHSISSGSSASASPTACAVSRARRSGLEEQAGDAELAQAGAGGSGLFDALCGQLVALGIRGRLAAAGGVVDRLAVAEEERPHSAAGAAPATTLTKFSRCFVVQHSKAPSQWRS